MFTSAEHALRGPALPLRRWSHLAMTWDGSVMRVYANGAQVASHALAGAAPVSDGPLRIGGNAIWPEFFKGVIDEVRVYDRALSAAEIAADRDAAVTPGAKRPRRGPHAAASRAGRCGPSTAARAGSSAARWRRRSSIRLRTMKSTIAGEDPADDPGQPVAAEAHPARVEDRDERARRDLLGRGEAGRRLGLRAAARGPTASRAAAASTPTRSCPAACS